MPAPGVVASYSPNRSFERFAWDGRRVYSFVMASNVSKSAAREVHDLPITPATLREIGLFGALSEEVLERLARMLKTMRVAPGDTIFTKETRPRARCMSCSTVRWRCRSAVVVDAICESPSSARRIVSERCR